MACCIITEMMQNVDNAMSDYSMGMGPMPPTMDSIPQTGSGMGWNSLRRPPSRMEAQPPESHRYS